MPSVRLFCGLLLACFVAQTALGFSGSVTRDTTWTTDMLITGNVTVRNGAVLTIRPDLTITFAGNYVLATEAGTAGRIRADSTLFTAMQHSPGSWRGILFDWDGGGQFRDCEIRYADRAIAILGFWDPVVVTRCHLHDNRIAFYHDGGADKAGSEQPEPLRSYISVEDCTIESNQVGIRVVWAGDALIRGNLIRNNSSAGVSLGDHCRGAVVQNQIVANYVGLLIDWYGMGGVYTVIGGSPENANLLHQNTTFDFRNQPGNGSVAYDISAQWNDWGPETTREMIEKGYPADIAAICDRWDNPAAGDVDYRNFSVSGVPARPAGGSSSFAAGTAIPNPFWWETRISFGRVDQAVASPAKAAILDAGGRLIRILEASNPPASTPEFRWDGRDDRGALLPAGVYFGRLPHGGGVVTTRIVRVGSAR